MGLMRLLASLALSAAAASAPTTVPEFEVPVGGAPGAAASALAPAPAAGAASLALTPSLALPPALGPSLLAPAAPVKPVDAAKPIAAAKPVAAVPVDLDAAEAEQGHKVVEKILSEHDPAEHAFIGVGRSPAIIVALMQNRDPDLAWSLPLSDFYHHPEGREKYYGPLPYEVEERLFDHFDRYLPTPAFTGAKKVVLIDYVKGGRSMIALDENLKRYAARRRPALRWTFFGLGMDREHSGFVEAGRRYRVLTPEELDGGSILHARMNYSWNKDLAEYDEFPAPFDDEKALERRKEYQAWRERLRKILEP